MKLVIKCSIYAMFILCISPVFAAGTLIPAPNRVDMAHDFVRNMIYISEGDQVLRYDVTTNTLLSPISIGGDLSGMDISPDGNTLAVADRTRSETDVRIHLINLDTNAAQQIMFPRAFGEGGTWTVAYGSDGKVLITSVYEGSGWVPLRSYDVNTGVTETLDTVRQNSMIISSGDMNTIAIAESNSSAGPFGKYDVVNQLIDSGPGTGWFNYEIGVNHNGTHFSVPTYGGTFIYDDSWVNLDVIGTYAGPQPIGLVYHPAEDLVYYAWRDSQEVREFDTATMTQTGAYNFEHTFVHNGNWAFTQGRLKNAADGSILMSTVSGGVRFIQLYAPLTATPQDLTTNENTPLPITLDASVGNNGTPVYSIIEPPLNGNVTGSGPDVIYSPDNNFSGNDSFIFRASYGKAFVDAAVAIFVVPGNNPPIAVDDTVDLVRKRAVIPVLENDSDPDGDNLQIVSITQPLHGTARIVDGNTRIYYRGRRNIQGPDNFTYTISDGNGETATATVTVNY